MAGEKPQETGHHREHDHVSLERRKKACPGSEKERPEDFDHRACYAKLDEWRKAHVVSQHICGVCVKACKGPKPTV